MQFVRTLIIFCFILIIGHIAVGSSARCAEFSADLYRVYINSRADADRLASLPIIPIHRLSDGYLVLISPQISEGLISSGLRSEMIAAGIDRRFLALDRRIDLPDAGGHDVIFQQGGIRLCRVDPVESTDKTVAARFFPLANQIIRIVYVPPLRQDQSVDVSSEFLDSLLMRVSEDSTISYSEYLQSLDGRLTMTYGTQMARYWLTNKFREFGYDSVITDVFSGPGASHYDFVTGHNVIAYKIGTENPYHHIIIGAHYDAIFDEYSGLLSPGADDNGSGVVAVLEIARALSHVDTRQTIVFVLFDAEEEWCVGSTAYARQAVESDDRIVLMLNMDMIGHYENDHDALVYMGMDSTAGNLWTTLADSIPGLDLIAHDQPGSASSDDLPFANAGYRTLSVDEYIFSSVYHSNRDSTTYLNFDYLTRMTRACLATIYVMDQQFVPDYELWMNFYPSAMEMIPPNRPSALDVAVREYGGAHLVPGSVQLHYSINGGDETTVAMTPVGDDIYTAEFPPVECLGKVTYHVTAEDESLGICYCPDEGQEQQVIAATGMAPTFEDYFETDKGWTVTTDAFLGGWRRETTYHNDYDGNGFYYFTGLWFGMTDGTSSLVSPPIVIDSIDQIFEYARWCTNYLVIGAVPDSFTAYIRNAAGGQWIPVENLAPSGVHVYTWRHVSFHVSDYLTPPYAVQLRFDATEFGHDADFHVAIDAVRFLGFSTILQVFTESLPNWTAYHPFSVQLDARTCAGPVTWVDRLGQLDGTGLTLSEDGLLSGIPTRVGPISFRARATDQLGASDEHILSFNIYDSLHVTTSTIPPAIIETEYSCQMKFSGGTGTKTWSDQGGLAETGIAFSSSGLLSGIPGIEGDFPFTALVTDQVGATAEKTFSLHIVGPYVCGDADGDSAVNIGDAVTIINYIFKGGTPPDPIEAGDANADGDVNIGDAVYLITFIFKGGPPPQCL